MQQLFTVTYDREVYALKTDDFGKATVLAERFALAKGKSSRITVIGSVSDEGRPDIQQMAADTLLYLGVD